MSRFVGTVVAVGCALAIGVHAQDSTVRTKTEVKGGDAKTVTYSGCVQTGTETQSFILNKVVPVGLTTEVGTSGTTTTTVYALVPGDKVTFQSYVGHKVEVTGMMMPAGDSKTETRTKIEREHAPDVTIKEKSKSEGAMPQFRVLSVKQLADSCS